MNTDTELQTLLTRSSGGVRVGYRALDCQSAAYGVNHTRELGEDTVSGRIGYPAPMVGDTAVDDLAVSLKSSHGALLVGPHQPRVTCHVGCENRHEAALVSIHGLSAVYSAHHGYFQQHRPHCSADVGVPFFIRAYLAHEGLKHFLGG
jgi:hypothetical protein